MVDWVLVDWGEDAVLLKDVADLADDSDFYAIMSARPGGRKGWERPYRLLYIGLAYHQTVEQRIKQIHSAYHRIAMYQPIRAGRDVIVMEGWIAEQSLDRVTLALCKAVESLLIFTNKPKHNTKHMKTHSGRPLVVECTGNYQPLKRFAASSTKAFNMWQDAN